METNDTKPLSVNDTLTAWNVLNSIQPGFVVDKKGRPHRELYHAFKHCLQLLKPTLRTIKEEGLAIDKKHAKLEKDGSIAYHEGRDGQPDENRPIPDPAKEADRKAAHKAYGDQVYDVRYHAIRMSWVEDSNLDMATLSAIDYAIVYDGEKEEARLGFTPAGTSVNAEA